MTPALEYFDNNPGAPGLTKHVHFAYDVFDHLTAAEVDPIGGGTYAQIAHYAVFDRFGGECFICGESL